jgi:hypothetical protein
MPCYIDAHDTVYAHFGYGDILVGHGHRVGSKKIDELLLYGSPTEEKHEVGESVKLTETTIDYDYPHIRMIFENVASLDVVLDTLQFIRAEMVKNAS